MCPKSRTPTASQVDVKFSPECQNDNADFTLMLGEFSRQDDNCGELPFEFLSIKECDAAFFRFRNSARNIEVLAMG